MSNTTITTTSTKKAHPLEKFFNIEPSSTEIVRDERETEIIEHSDYDAKDAELERAFQEIADAAMTTYGLLQDLAEDSESRTALAAYDGSATMLKTALEALRSRADLKKNKDKLLAKAKSGGNKTTNNILVVDDRNAVLSQLMNLPDNQIDDIVSDQ